MALNSMMAADMTKTVERRSHVRGNFSFKVKFKLLSRQAYENLERSGEVCSAVPEKVADLGPGVDQTLCGADASLIEYLIQIDEKLDLVLETLAREQDSDPIFFKGIGRDISGSGMRIEVAEPLETGQLIQVKMLLSKIPFLFVDLIGEIMSATPKNRAEERGYYLGVKFIDLSPDDRERIIGAVFQNQRAEIRKQKNTANEGDTI